MVWTDAWISHCDSYNTEVNTWHVPICEGQTLNCLVRCFCEMSYWRIQQNTGCALSRPHPHELWEYFIYIYIHYFFSIFIFIFHFQPHLRIIGRIVMSSFWPAPIHIRIQNQKQIYVCIYVLHGNDFLPRNYRFCRTSDKYIQHTSHSYVFVHN